MEKTQRNRLLNFIQHQLEDLADQSEDGCTIDLQDVYDLFDTLRARDKGYGCLLQKAKSILKE